MLITSSHHPAIVLLFIITVHVVQLRLIIHSRKWEDTVLSRPMPTRIKTCGVFRMNKRQEPPPPPPARHPQQ
jgi:hypothetical protein